ncbi:hypothetical protein BKA69DRAFT_1125562 [Paraphysoderma sedebokerense]|nr:hypothetical protein BKA69DRAFT_1125562 [Paraphysoderma sedebokerense]
MMTHNSAQGKANGDSGKARSLHQHTLRPMISLKKDLIDIPVSASIRQLVDTLQRNKILSVPVFGEAGRWIGAGGVNAVADEGKQYIGIVSLLDVVMWLVTVESKEIERNERVSDETIQRYLNETTVRNIIGESDESLSLWITRDDAGLMGVLEPLTKGVHRWLVAAHPNPLAPTSTVYRLCTQSDVLAYLRDNMSLFSHLQPVTSQTIDSLNLVTTTHPVLTVTTKSTLLSVLKGLCDHNISSVPVIDPTTKKLMSTFSISDLRNVEFKFPFIEPTLTVGRFLRLEERMVGEDIKHRERQLELVARRENTLWDVIQRMVNKRLHRVWVVDELERPVGVITLTDVLRTLFDFARKAEA